MKARLAAEITMYIMTYFANSKIHYIWPLNKEGVRGADPLHSFTAENPCIVDPPYPRIQPTKDSCNTAVFTTETNPYKWIQQLNPLLFKGQL